MNMTPGNWFLLAMGAQYIAASTVFAFQRNWGYALCMLCYGVANYGLILAGK